MKHRITALPLLNIFKTILQNCLLNFYLKNNICLRWFHACVVFYDDNGGVIKI